MKKNLFIPLIIILLLLVSGVTYIFLRNNVFKSSNDNSVGAEDDTVAFELERTIFESNDSSDDSDDLDNSKLHDLQLEIISPEGDIFESRQARYYNAWINGNNKYDNIVNCHWDFYLNENNEEVLYETMDNRSRLSEESQKICGFTSTFIDSRGELRVVLTMTVQDLQSNDLETISAERLYTVK